MADNDMIFLAGCVGVCLVLLFAGLIVFGITYLFLSLI